MMFLILPRCYVQIHFIRSCRIVHLELCFSQLSTSE